MKCGPASFHRAPKYQNPLSKTLPKLPELSAKSSDQLRTLAANHHPCRSISSLPLLPLHLFSNSHPSRHLASVHSYVTVSSPGCASHVHWQLPNRRTLQSPRLSRAQATTRCLPATRVHGTLLESDPQALNVSKIVVWPQRSTHCAGRHYHQTRSRSLRILLGSLYGSSQPQHAQPRRKPQALRPRVVSLRATVSAEATFDGSGIRIGNEVGWHLLLLCIFLFYRFVAFSHNSCHLQTGLLRSSRPMLRLDP